MRRLPEIDIFRGLLLLIIVINHTPSPAREFTTQPLGFVSAAEAFVFISAFLAGLVFSHKFQTHGELALRQLAYRRTRQIYLAHFVTLLFCLTVVGRVLGQLPPFHNMVHHYLEQPFQAGLSALLLLYQPPLLDILPMYLVFLFFTPSIVKSIAQSGWLLVLSLSLSIWLAAQFGINEWLIGALTSNWLVISPGAFNLFAWQLLWVIGLSLGYWIRQGQTNTTALFKSVGPFLAAIALFFFCWRWRLVPGLADSSNYYWLINKWRLGALRLVNFLALLGVSLWLRSYITKALLWLKPLAALGRHILPLFCVHICLGLLLIGFIELYNIPAYGCCLLLLFHIGLILLLSQVLERHSDKRLKRTDASLLPS